MRTRGRLAVLLASLVAMLGAAACGDDDAVAPDERGTTPSAVGEPGNESSETGGGGAPAEGVEDKNSKD